MIHSKIPVAQSIVHLCLSKGIDTVIISPGSRNAPLTIEFTKHPQIKAYSIVDERCAAFVGLGIAQQTGRPVALVCTSGSALLNYYPAISEAFYSDIPLVAISADRPIERIDIGDGQTIRQKNVFENHILYSANLYSELVPTDDVTDAKVAQKIKESQRHNNQEINKALNVAIEQSGPVHINVPFYEPLYEMTERVIDTPIEIAPQVVDKELSNSELASYAQDWNKATRKLVIIGVQDPETMSPELLDLLGNDPSVVVFTETTSNVAHPNFFTRIDNIIGSLDDAGFKDLQPEILLTFGGMVVSKKVKAFLRNYQPIQHWHVDAKKAYDTYFCLNRHFEVSASLFLEKLQAVTVPKESTYQEDWLRIRAKRDRLHSEYIAQMSWCDFKAFDHILEVIPDNSVLQLGNSSTVRYAQLFDVNKTLEVYCNRGTSGIDGSTSTAIGSAMASKKLTTLITGELSFFYDSNALWNQYIPNDFKIIVINNSGGGIFRILPNKDKNTDNFDEFFETTHHLEASKLCEMYNFKYLKATNEEECALAKNELYAYSSQPTLLEIFTPRKINDEVLLDYFKFIK
ncbi:2-succinyl-5-enolpyruvyl-6-hydroxy-3-cyclohexene-1-carboxylic-acid synthase [Dokdonia donghaensis]|uniref:2-succinyl-5-enolpyruvyl-6-hydroxy-3-cyclohexene-1-carboxylate synthase n=1 Tax=Dokdonia donghaensis DSW-1 TaxID=1300343 RepID=A0A0A2GYZ6_9FLAO|nr:2-succinyl-5-enolpyruvyl-6-hydroxy-3-cyclohexene-1-carboxylic-acid synthase [Dokdonia donghaensis]ANH60503.1 2-succinyl-5-enolpyruvyl-6-hydroxy-3-cyclohexene-1-carboxylate synthase [Dokdonia donghaensis DSW-1]KGO07763.1 2-succinyl-5-enolpyruvyl-6-hydroxy-3-cyclohexene-1-carboxylate synthase [Dokdonia donghaensis DSW-1]